ncbi:hypothetical protein E2320_010077, partial [Naja naja]
MILFQLVAIVNQRSALIEMQERKRLSELSEHAPLACSTFTQGLIQQKRFLSSYCCSKTDAIGQDLEAGPVRLENVCTSCKINNECGCRSHSAPQEKLQVNRRYL